MSRCRQIGGLIALVAALAAVGGCSTMRLEARPNIPQPVIEPIPISIGLYLPIEFSNYLFKGERYGYNWEVALGAAQSEALSRLITAMFQQVVRVENVATAQQAGPGIRAVLEPSLEEFSFVTPRDAGTPFYAVSIKYRVSVYTPEGRLAESWPFTGYGIVPSTGMSAQKPLAKATALAMRDAGAKLVVEFRDQAIIRGLLPDSPEPDTLPSPVESATPAVSGQEAPAEAASPAGSEPAPTAPTPPAGETPALPANETEAFPARQGTELQNGTAPVS